jgi:hypothetical protein
VSESVQLYLTSKSNFFSEDGALVAAALHGLGLTHEWESGFNINGTAGVATWIDFDWATYVGFAAYSVTSPARRRPDSDSVCCSVHSWRSTCRTTLQQGRGSAVYRSKRCVVGKPQRRATALCGVIGSHSCLNVPPVM